MVKQKLLRLNFGIADQVGFSKPIFDMLKLPWPIKAASVEEIHCFMRLHYVTAEMRPSLMDEFYRVLIPGGKCHIAVPYWTSMRSVQDYATQWPPFCEASFMYFNKQWRELNHPDRKLKCDFDFTFGYQADQETAARSDDSRSFYIKHYCNSVLDLSVVLTKK